MTLGERITETLGGKPEHGTVIRWETEAGYLYMALCVNGDQWYTTAQAGNPYVPQVVSSGRLLQLLTREATSIGVTNDFEEVPT